MLCDVRLVVSLQEKFEIDQLQRTLAAVPHPALGTQALERVVQIDACAVVETKTWTANVLNCVCKESYVKPKALVGVNKGRGWGADQGDHKN